MDDAGELPTPLPKKTAKALRKEVQAEYDAALSALSKFEDARRKLEEAGFDLDSKIKAMRDKYDADLAPLRAELSSISPISLDSARSPPTKRAAYSDRTAALMSKFALLAYKRFEEDDGKKLLQALLKQAGFELLATYEANSTEAFLAQNDDFCVLAFRGTTSKADWKINQQFSPGKARIPGHPRDVAVHSGFLGAFLPLETDIRVHMHNLTGERPIYITGHSLGGALSLVASAVLGGAQTNTTLPPLGDRIAAVYTFGAPRVGGKDFELCVKAPHYRIVNKDDIVPWVPPTWLFGYRHSGDVRILRGFGQRPASEQWPANLAFTALWMLFLYVTGIAWLIKYRSTRIDDHEVKRYVAKLDRIALKRGAWK